MPDDVIDNEEGAMTDDELAAAFDDVDVDGPPPTETGMGDDDDTEVVDVDGAGDDDGQDGDTETTAEDADTEEVDDDGDEDGDDSGDGEEETAAKRLERLAAERKAEADRQAEAQKGEEQQAEARQRAAAIFENAIRDGKLVVGDTEFSMEDIADNYGEEFIPIVQGLVTSTTAEVQRQANEQIGQMEARYQQQLAEVQAGFAAAMQVQSRHPDAFTLMEDKAFNEWLDKSGDGVKLMWNEGGAQGGIAVLDAYKEFALGQRNRKVDASRRAAKTKTDAVHSTTLRSSRGTARRRANAGNAPLSEAEMAREFDSIKV